MTKGQAREMLTREAESKIPPDSSQIHTGSGSPTPEPKLKWLIIVLVIKIFFSFFPGECRQYP
jgi:hypothetical protein